MPVLARLQSDYQDQGLQVLAINIDSGNYSLEEWASFMATFAPDGMQSLVEAMAAQDVNNQAAYQYKLKVLGTEVIVDRKGRVTFRSEGSSGYWKLKSEIEKVL